MDSKALYNLTYGVFMISAKAEGKVNGCITNTFIQVAGIELPVDANGIPYLSCNQLQNIKQDGSWHAHTVHSGNSRCKNHKRKISPHLCRLPEQNKTQKFTKERRRKNKGMEMQDMRSCIRRCGTAAGFFMPSMRTSQGRF